LGESRWGGAWFLAVAAPVTLPVVQRQQTDPHQDELARDKHQSQKRRRIRWITVVAALARSDSATLNPKQFWRTIAKQGGYLARTRDPRPGWKVLWRGWYDIQQMVRGAQLVGNQGCG